MHSLPGIGPRLAAKLEKLGIWEPGDLLFHLPLRYEDRTRYLSIGELQIGTSSVVTAQIESVKVRIARKRVLIVKVSDAYGNLFLRFFHFNRNMQENLKTGYCIRCFGEVRLGNQGLEMIHPEYRLFQKPDDLPEPEQYLTPVYPTTEGIGQTKIRKLVSDSLQQQANRFNELMPAEILNRYQLIPIVQALAICHQPTPDANTALMMQGLHPAQQRLALEEMLSHRLALWKQRKKRERVSAPVFSC